MATIGIGFERHGRTPGHRGQHAQHHPTPATAPAVHATKSPLAARRVEQMHHRAVDRNGGAVPRQQRRVRGQAGQVVDCGRTELARDEAGARTGREAGPPRLFAGAGLRQRPGHHSVAGELLLHRRQHERRRLDAAGGEGLRPEQPAGRLRDRHTVSCRRDRHRAAGPAFRPHAGTHLGT